MLCPLARKEGETCDGKMCMWWMEEDKNCAVTAIAMALMGSYAVSRETRYAIAVQEASEKCEKCKGKGKVWTSQTMQEECPDCDGTGRQ